MTHLALNGNTVVFIFSIIALTIIISIVCLRYYWKIKLKNSAKGSKISPLKNTVGLHGFGICIALLATITLMSWTKADRAVHNYSPDPVEDFIDIIKIPRTTVITRKPKPIPPAPKPNPVIVEVEDLVEIEKPVEVPLEVPIDAVVETSDEASNLPQPKPDVPVEKPKEIEIDVFEIYTRAERMPRFPGCEDADISEAEKMDCTDTELMKYVYGNLKYPRMARENGIEGRVILQFVVDTNGDISDIKVVRDIGGGCGAAASKVVQEMVEKEGFWTPGRQRNRKVKVRYTLPITFELAD